MMTLLFRFLAGVIVYVIIAVVVVACLAGTITLWIVWHLKKTNLGKGKGCAAYLTIVWKI